MFGKYRKVEERKIIYYNYKLLLGVYIILKFRLYEDFFFVFLGCLKFLFLVVVDFFWLVRGYGGRCFLLIEVFI